MSQHDVEQDHDFIFNWNRLKKVASLSPKPFDLFDETLRDGIQSPSVTDPTVQEKVEIIHLMESLGIGSADLGLPGAGKRAYEDTLALVQEIDRTRMKLKPAAAARTMVKDIQPIVDITQKTGVAVEVYAFIGSSPIRLFSEDWSADSLMGHIEESIKFAVSEGQEICLVTEDTTRSRPEVLDPLFRRAIELGANRLCLCDTVGHATPDGIHNLFDWTRSLLRGLGAEHVKLDWHGHNDRGLGVTNAIIAIEAGADRVHGTGLGVGERVGNASMDQILLNLKLLDEWEPGLEHLLLYCQAISRACRVDIPYNYPMAGRDAFRTGTGVHAAAIIKAQKKGDHYLADRVYSGVPAGMFGRHQEIEIGHMSGFSNVIFWLESRRIPVEEELAQGIFAKAKAINRVLSEDEIMSVVRNYQNAKLK
ncbi:MAG: LeuA family protein [Myxococcota bacterium]|nr:LeuA family protein [Myxococcota bacterium]